MTIFALRLAEHCDMSRSSIMEAALFHDAEEAWTGDIPSPMKKMIDGARVPKSKMLGDMAWLANEEMQTVQALVKIADLACDIKFLICYGDGRHADQVREQIAQRLENHIENTYL